MEQRILLVETTRLMYTTDGTGWYKDEDEAPIPCMALPQRGFRTCLVFPTVFASEVERPQRRSEAFRALEEAESQFVNNLAGDIRGWISKSNWFFYCSRNLLCFVFCS